MSVKIYRVESSPSRSMSILGTICLLGTQALTFCAIQGQETAPPVKPAKSSLHLRLSDDTRAAFDRVWDRPLASKAPRQASVPENEHSNELLLVTNVEMEQDEKSVPPAKLPTISRLLELTSSSGNRQTAASRPSRSKKASLADENRASQAKMKDPSESGTEAREDGRMTIEFLHSYELAPDAEATLREDEEPSRETETAQQEIRLTLSASVGQSTSKGEDSSDVDRECPGAPSEKVEEQSPQPDDLPLEETERPYDAPKAESMAENVDNGPTVEQLTPQARSLRDRINRCLEYYLAHPENVVRRGPWALMHATLPFGVEAEIIAGNRRVNAIGWMCFNGECAKQRMFQPTKTGFRTNVGPGVQGHEGQFLAILAQSKVQPNYPIRIGSRKYTIQDLVRYEMATCRENSELTFKLLGLSYYLDQNQSWRDSRGGTWNLEKMVREELAQPINGAACGGTHRLMALSFAVIRRQMAGFPLTGTWHRAEAYLNNYVNYTMTLQNPDGSFSTEWFERRGQDPDVERRVQTTGHILEWLIYTLPDEHLKSPRIVSSVEYLLQTVGSDPGRDWPIGPRGHVVRALALYNQRVFGAEPGKLKTFIAESRPQGRLR